MGFGVGGGGVVRGVGGGGVVAPSLGSVEELRLDAVDAEGRTPLDEAKEAGVSEARIAALSAAFR